MKIRSFCTVRSRAIALAAGFALTLLISLLITSSPAFGQDKKTRCDTKKAESRLLEKKRKDLEVDMIAPGTYLSFARDDLSLFNRAITALDDPDWRTSKIRSEFNSQLRLSSFAEQAKYYGVDQNFDNVRLDDRDSMKQYVRTIRPYIIQRIERLKFIKDNPEAARKELREYEKQLASINAAIRELKCDEPEKPESTCTMEGSWIQYATGLGRSTWYVTSDGKATESGLGGSAGTASLNKNVMRIDWTNPNGWSGYYEWTMDAACMTGEGQLIFKSGGSGSRKSTVTHE